MTVAFSALAASQLRLHSQLCALRCSLKVKKINAPQYCKTIVRVLTQNHSPFVFHADYNNKPWRNTNQFRNRFHKLCVLAGIRYRRPYMMRHTYASMLLKEGENENFVARQLGHVDTQMLRKVYGEFIPDSGSNNGYQLRGDWLAIEKIHSPALPALSSEIHATK